MLRIPPGRLRPIGHADVQVVEPSHPEPRTLRLQSLTIDAGLTHWRQPGSGLGLQHGLGLDDQSHRSIVIIEQVGLNDDCSTPYVYRPCDRSCETRANATEEVRLGLDRRSGRSIGQIEEGADRSHAVSQSHDCTAMEDPITSALLRRPCEGADNLVSICRLRLHAEKAAERHETKERCQSV